MGEACEPNAVVNDAQFKVRTNRRDTALQGSQHAALQERNIQQLTRRKDFV
jgi:hypothetical protein